MLLLLLGVFVGSLGIYLSWSVARNHSFQLIIYIISRNMCSLLSRWLNNTKSNESEIEMADVEQSNKPGSLFYSCCIIHIYKYFFPYSYFTFHLHIFPVMEESNFIIGGIGDKRVAFLLVFILSLHVQEKFQT